MSILHEGFKRNGKKNTKLCVLNTLYKKKYMTCNKIQDSLLGICIWTIER